MNEQIKINNPIKIQDDSESRVAFDLMKEIANAEISADKADFDDPRAYYLKLYRECLKAVVRKGNFTDLS